MELLSKIEAETGKVITSIKEQVDSNSPVGKFIISMKNRMGIGSPERNATDTYERGMQIIPSCISANENEIPVRQYNIAVLRNLLKFERAEGRMQVTNKRVIFRAVGRSVRGRTTLQHEFAIDEIAGIEAINNFKFSFLYLIFAILIIAFASLILYQSPVNYRFIPPEIELFGESSPPRIESNEAREYRIYRTLNPKHVQEVYVNERLAISRTRTAEENVQKAQAELKTKKEAEEKAFADVTRGRIQTGTDYRGNPTYRSATPAEAQSILNITIEEREKAEADEQFAISNLITAQEDEAEAIKKRGNTVMAWRVLMTIFGLIVGIGGLIPFFLLNKKFGLKLFLLCFSIFGFTLALAASGFGLFGLLLFLTNIIMLICVFLFCFRPNLIIGIKNKGGIAAAVDIRRDTIFSRRAEKGVGFREVIPTDETESAIREIGAIINDIQKLGDIGLQKWVK
jgi:hypothetical protein